MYEARNSKSKIKKNKNKREKILKKFFRICNQKYKVNLSIDNLEYSMKVIRENFLEKVPFRIANHFSNTIDC